MKNLPRDDIESEELEGADVALQVAANDELGDDVSADMCQVSMKQHRHKQSVQLPVVADLEWILLAKRVICARIDSKERLVIDATDRKSCHVNDDLDDTDPKECGKD